MSYSGESLLKASLKGSRDTCFMVGVSLCAWSLRWHQGTFLHPHGPSNSFKYSEPHTIHTIVPVDDILTHVDPCVCVNLCILFNRNNYFYNIATERLRKLKSVITVRTCITVSFSIWMCSWMSCVCKQINCKLKVCNTPWDFYQWYWTYLYISAPILESHSCRLQMKLSQPLIGECQTSEVSTGSSKKFQPALDKRSKFRRRG